MPASDQADARDGAQACLPPRGPLPLFDADAEEFLVGPARGFKVA